MATPLGARRGFVVFVTVLFAVLAAAEAGVVTLAVVHGNPGGVRLSVLAGLGALAFAILAVIYARQWRRMARAAHRSGAEPAGGAAGRDPRRGLRDHGPPGRRGSGV